MKNQQIKVFSMNEYDWWADFSLDEARKNYRAYLLKENLISEIDDFDEPEELSIEEMHQSRFYDGYDDQIRTFYDQLLVMIDRGEEFPCLFGSTEY